MYSYTCLKIANKNLSKIGFELVFTCSYVLDDGRRRPSHRDGSGGGHGHAAMNPLLRIPSGDTWAASRLRNRAGGAFGRAAAPDLGGCCATSKPWRSSAATTSALAVNDRHGRFDAADT